LAWVRVADRIHHVSEFSTTPRNLRPQCSCPECGEPVVLKLGAVLAHHCAHAPGSICPATESAEHINAKFHIWKQLLSHLGEPLKVQVTCAGSPFEPRCNQTADISWIETWDEAQLEYAVASIRPDITLLSSRKPVAAIEIFATHRVDENKSAAFAGLGIPWIEVEAKIPLDLQWTPAAPIPVRQGSSQETWRCEACADTKQCCDDYSLGASNADLNEQQLCAAPGVRMWRTRLVDLYYQSGKRYREQFSVYLLCREQRQVAVYIVTHSDGQIVEWVAYPELEQWRCDTLADFARQSFERYLANRRERSTVVDSPMDWTQTLPDYTRTWPAPRYRWDRASSLWLLSPDHNDTRWRVELDGLGRGRRPTMRWC
jgi:hypothetical protein